MERAELFHVYSVHLGNLSKVFRSRTFGSVNHAKVEIDLLCKKREFWKKNQFAIMSGDSGRIVAIYDLTNGLVVLP